MQNKTQARTPVVLTAILLALTAATALIRVATAVTSDVENMELIVQDKPPEVLRIDVTETSGTSNDGFILAGTTTALVTYKVVLFDRNGEVDMRDDASLAISVYGPGANGVKQTSTLVTQNSNSIDLTFPTASGGECEGLSYTDTPASAQAATSGDLAVGPGKLTDNSQTNGVLDCQFTLLFNVGGVASTTGEYTIRIDPGAGGTAKEIVTVVFETLDALIQLVDAGGTVQAGGSKVSFGDGAAQNLNAQPAAGNRIKITQNAQAEFKVDLTFTDLACTACPPDATGQVKSIAKTAVSYKEAFNANPTVATTDANVPAGGSISSTNTAHVPGDNIRFAFILDDLTTQGQANELLKDGGYTGTITVALRGDTTGEGAYYYNGSSYDPSSPSTPRTHNPGAATVTPADGLGLVTIGTV